jgi:hypothetical protein
MAVVQPVVGALVGAYPLLPTQAVVVVLARMVGRRVKAAQASSSSPMLAHRNFLVVLSLLLAATPFTHSRLLALLVLLPHCLQATLWLLVVVQVVAHKILLVEVVRALVDCGQVLE